MMPKKWQRLFTFSIYSYRVIVFISYKLRSCQAGKKEGAILEVDIIAKCTIIFRGGLAWANLRGLYFYYNP